MTQTNNDIEELEELLNELEGQEAQLVSPYSEDDDAVTQLMDAPVGDQEWMVQVTALDRRMMSTEALVAELQAGRLSNKTLVWRGGMDDWLPASRVDAIAQASLVLPSSSSPRLGVGSLPPPPTPLAAPPAWATLPSVPLAPPPAVALPSMQMNSAPAPALDPMLPSNVGFPAAGGSNLDLPRPVVVPLPPPPSNISLGNTTRPVAVDFDDIPMQSPSPLRGKRSVMALSAVAILAGFITVYTMASKSDGTASAEAPATKSQPHAVSALQPVAAPEHKAETPAPAPSKAAEPAPEPAKPAAMAAAVTTNEEPAAAPPSRATNAPARYSPRSEYRRRYRSSSAAERAEASESESSPQVSSSRAVAARTSAPAEEAPATNETASAAADDDADATEAPKSTGKSSNNTFNREAAKNALDEAAQQARNCRPAGGPSGTGRVQVRYEPSGKVANVAILTSKFDNTTAGSCVRMLFRRAKVPEFTGAPVVVVNKSFEIP
jgi:hypothetical protein